MTPHTPRINQIMYSPNFVSSESQLFKYSKHNAVANKAVNSTNGENVLFQQPVADVINKQNEQRDGTSVYNIQSMVVSKTDSTDVKATATLDINTPLCGKAISDVILKTAAENSAATERLRAASGCEQKQYISKQSNQLCDPNQRSDGLIAHSHQNVNQKLQQVYCNHSEMFQNSHNFFVNKNIKPAYLSNPSNSAPNVFKSQVSENQTLTIVNATAKTTWQNRMPSNVNQHLIPPNHLSQIEQNTSINKLNVYGKTSPIQNSELSGSVWIDDARKKMKLNKSTRKRSCIPDVQSRSMECQELNTNVDIRCISGENESVTVRQLPPHSHYAPSPSFMDDPSGYLAQQTALLNNTINRQTSKYYLILIQLSYIDGIFYLGSVACGNYMRGSPAASVYPPQNAPVPSYVSNSGVHLPCSIVSQIHNSQNSSIVNTHSVPSNSVTSTVSHHNQVTRIQSPMMSSPLSQRHCQGCAIDNAHIMKSPASLSLNTQDFSVVISQSSISCAAESTGDPATSSIQLEGMDQEHSDLRPIQAGTISTSNMSPADSQLLKLSPPVVPSQSSVNKSVDSTQAYESHSMYTFTLIFIILICF